MSGYVEDRILQFEFAGRTQSGIMQPLPPGTRTFGSVQGGPTQLPMPQWSRIATLDRQRYPMEFTQDHLKAEDFPVVSAEVNADGSVEYKAKIAPVKTSSPDKFLERNPTAVGDIPIAATHSQSGAQQRIQYLERNINFLRSQHAEVLDKLHNEIADLKRQNNELQYKVLENRDPLLLKAESRSKTDVPSTRDNDRKPHKGPTFDSKESNPLAAEETELRISELRTQLAKSSDEKEELLRKNELLNAVVSKLQAKNRKLQGKADVEGIHLMTTPVMVQREGDKNPKRPSVTEYEALLRHLSKVNQHQQREIEQLRLDLKELLQRHKPSEPLTPHGSSNSQPDLGTQESPRDNGLRSGRSNGSDPSQVLLTGYGPQALEARSFALPALRSNVGNKALERRKRTQILQKAKIKQQLTDRCPHVTNFG